MVFRQSALVRCMSFFSYDPAGSGNAGGIPAEPYSIVLNFFSVYLVFSFATFSRFSGFA